MLRYWSSLRYSFLRTLFLLADDLRYTCMYIYPPLSINLSLSINQSICLSVSLSLYIYIYIYIYKHI